MCAYVCVFPQKHTGIIENDGMQSFWALAGMQEITTAELLPSSLPQRGRNEFLLLKPLLLASICFFLFLSLSFFLLPIMKARF